MQLSALLGVDNQWFVAMLPRLLQACLAAVGDIAAAYVYMRVLGSHRGKWAYAMHMLNFFMLYAFVRPFSNCVESALFWMALALWPSPTLLKQEAHEASVFDWQTASTATNYKLVAAVGLGGLSIALRPTAAVPWAFLGLVLVLQQRSIASAVKLTIAAGSALGLVLAASVGLDTLIYGGEGYTIVLWNFFDFNFNAGLSALYGTHPWHWYLTAALPSLLGLMLPLLLVGVYQGLRSSDTRAGAAFWVSLLLFCVGVYSTNGHKEFRFLFPLYPVLFMFCGVAMHSIAKPFFTLPTDEQRGNAQTGPAAAASSPQTGIQAHESTQAEATAPRARRSLADEGSEQSNGAADHTAPAPPAGSKGAEEPKEIPTPAAFYTLLYSGTLVVLVLGNVAAAVYLGLVHQGGVVAAVDFIAAEAAAFRATPGTIYNPELYGTSGATAQAHEWNYIRERVSLGVLPQAMVPGIPPPTYDKSVLRRQPLQGPKRLSWGEGEWLQPLPHKANGLSDRFKHTFQPVPESGSVMSLLADTEAALDTWMEWPIMREKIALWVTERLCSTAAVALGLVSLDPWGNVAAKPNVRRAELRWSMRQKDLQRSAAAKQSTGAKAEYVPMIVHFWLSCYSTPFYSVVHEPIEMTQLECPPLARQAGDTDAARFLRDPETFLQRNWYGSSPAAPLPALPVSEPTLAVHDLRYAGPVKDIRLPAWGEEAEWIRRFHSAKVSQTFNHIERYNATRDSNSLPLTGKLPTHIVTTAGIANRMRGWLRMHEYYQAASFFQAHMQGDADANPGADFGRVVVLRHSSWTPWALMTGRAFIAERK